MFTNVKTRLQDAGLCVVQTACRAAFPSLLLFALGVGSASAVDIEQRPLIVQQTLPPNIVLLYDDSGSMGRNYLPDDAPEGGQSGFRDSTQNRQYYDPNTLYAAPPRADGSSYPESSFPSGYQNPFSGGSTDNILDQNDYSEAVTAKVVDDSITNSNSCNNAGGTWEELGECRVTTTYEDDTIDNRGECNQAGGDWVTIGRWWFRRQVCQITTTQVDSSITNENDCQTWRQDREWVATGGQCVLSESQVDAFVYVDAGQEHHVVDDNDSCNGLSHCHKASDQLVINGETTTYGQNVANFYSYYRRRDLSAKSGLMIAFAATDPRFRVGFGSINGNALSEINDISTTACADGFAAACRYVTNSGRYGVYNAITGVSEWGDGSSGTRRAQFWNWLEAVNSNSRTPLRRNLESVGDYYLLGQPWKALDGSGVEQEYSCRQSYTILTTDGYWNGSDPGVGNVDGTDGADLGAEDDGRILGPNGVDYLYDAEKPFSDSLSGTLADVAMYYWKNDLRDGTDNFVPTTDDDPAFWQHMTTFGIGLGVEPALADDGGGTIADIFDWARTGASGVIDASAFDWGSDQIADLAHAAVNGHGGFYSARNPREFSRAIEDALARAAERVGTGSSLAANATRLDTGTVTYQANYFTGSWKGDLKAYPVDPNTGEISASADWLAANNLLAAPRGTCTATGDQVCPDSRTIYTFDTSSTGSNNDNGYREFRAGELSNLSTDQQSALGGSSTEQQDMLNYLRGDETNTENNGGSFRDRNTALGDIVNSQPVYVGKPNPNLYTSRSFTGVDEYTAFVAARAGRTPAIYVAANDGMLHGFNASTGSEIYAYLPGAVIKSGITDLADPEYGASVDHQFFNDGELTVADVYLPTNGNNGEWRTVLVGTTGRGEAKAIYALDVTDPANVQFLWERSAGDGLSGSDYIGQMVGKPLVIQTGDGEWSVVLGNGYNSAQDKAALLEFNIEDGGLSVHATDNNLGNGLAAPATFDYSGPDGIQDVAYAGDLNGRVWRFDLANGGGGAEVFQARDANNNPQPITAGMLLGKNPDTSNLWAFFGTGKYLSQADLNDDSVQTWYGLIVGSADAGRVIGAGDGRDALIQRSIEGEIAPTGSTLGARVFSKGTDGDISSYSGWYMDLVYPADTPVGERMVVPNKFQGSVLVGTSLVPEAVDICNPSGRGYIMGLDPFDGTNVDEPFIDYNGDGVVDSSDTVTVDGEPYAVGGVNFNRVANFPIFVSDSMLIAFDDGSNASILTSSGGSGAQRTSWRELIAD